LREDDAEMFLKMDHAVKILQIHTTKQKLVKSGDVLSAEFEGTYVHAAVTLQQ
jgi:hypothetical protein